MFGPWEGARGAGHSLCSISGAWTIKLWKFNCDNCIINLTHLSPPGVTVLTINGLRFSPLSGPDTVLALTGFHHGNRAWVINCEAREPLLCYALWTRTKLSIQVLNAHINVGHGWTPLTRDHHQLSLATNQRLGWLITDQSEASHYPHLSRSHWGLISWW